jgi:hypothetical protein
MTCSFCGRRLDDAHTLILGTDANICDSCLHAAIGDLLPWWKGERVSFSPVRNDDEVEVKK